MVEFCEGSVWWFVGLEATVGVGERFGLYRGGEHCWAWCFALSCNVLGGRGVVGRWSACTMEDVRC